YWVELRSERSVLGWHRLRNRRRTVRSGIRFGIAGIAFLSHFRFRGDSSENHGSGLLHGFQTLAQEIGVSVPKLDVIGTRGRRFKTDPLADHERHCLGFGFAHFLRGEGATVATMQHLVSDLVYQRREFLGWLHPGK